MKQEKNNIQNFSSGAQKVWDIIDSLPGEESTIIHLVHANLSCQNISSIINHPEWYVKELMAYSLANLYKELFHKKIENIREFISFLTKYDYSEKIHEYKNTGTEPDDLKRLIYLIIRIQTLPDRPLPKDMTIPPMNTVTQNSIPDDGTKKNSFFGKNTFFYVHSFIATLLIVVVSVFIYQQRYQEKAKQPDTKKPNIIPGEIIFQENFELYPESQSLLFYRNPTMWQVVGKHAKSVFIKKNNDNKYVVFDFNSSDKAWLSFGLVQKVAHFWKTPKNLTNAVISFDVASDLDDPISDVLSPAVLTKSGKVYRLPDSMLKSIPAKNEGWKTVSLNISDFTWDNQSGTYDLNFDSSQIVSIQFLVLQNVNWFATEGKLYLDNISIKNNKKN